MKPIFLVVNILGALALLPILFVSAFGFDQPGAELFAAMLLVTNLVFPVLSVVGLCRASRRYLGLLGLLITVICWNLIGFTCRAAGVC